MSGVHLGAGRPTAGTSASARRTRAFIAPLGHIAARLHAIGNQARQAVDGGPYRTDDPDLRPRGPQDRRGRPDPRRPAGAPAAAGELPARHGHHAHPVGPGGGVDAGRRGAGAAPGGDRAVRHPAQRDRARPREAGPGAGRGRAARGVYRLRAPKAKADGVLVLQGSERDARLHRRRAAAARAGGRGPRRLLRGQRRAVRRAAAPRSASASSPSRWRRRPWPSPASPLATTYRWVRSDRGRAATLHPYSHGHYLGSGPGRPCCTRPGWTPTGSTRPSAASSTRDRGRGRRRGAARGPDQAAGPGRR